MELPRLQIKRLSDSGELLSCINCLAGQITVLRGITEQDLAPYQRAITGLPGKERFSLNYADSSFSPTEHSLIGFGSRLESQQSVHDLLLSCGLTESALASLLLSYGLSELSNTSCTKLSPCAMRRVELLAAFNSSDKAIILNDPFEPLAEEWREPLAEYLLHATWQNKRVVLVTSLNYRPQSWIGNELINRVQVGADNKRTIGFAGAADDVNIAVKELRERLASEALAKESKEPDKTPELAATFGIPTDKHQHPSNLRFLLVGTTLFCALLLVVIKSGVLQRNAILPSKSTAEQIAKVSAVEVPQQKSVSNNPPTQQPPTSTKALPPRMPDAARGLAAQLPPGAAPNGLAGDPREMMRSRMLEMMKRRGMTLPPDPAGGAAMPPGFSELAAPTHTPQVGSTVGTPPSSDLSAALPNTTSSDVVTISRNTNSELDYYPLPTKAAILEAFAQTDPGKQDAGFLNKVPGKTVTAAAPNPFADLASLPSRPTRPAESSDVGTPSPLSALQRLQNRRQLPTQPPPIIDEPTNEPANEEMLKQRHEEIRAKFLEAINRAVKKKEGDSNLDPIEGGAVSPFAE